jgi:hypothetical protein
MKILVMALTAASLAIPSAGMAQSQGGKSADKRQDTGFPPESRGECERIAKRANADARKSGDTTRFECVQEGDSFFVRPVGGTSPS